MIGYIILSYSCLSELVNSAIRSMNDSKSIGNKQNSSFIKGRLRGFSLSKEETKLLISIDLF